MPTSPKVNTYYQPTWLSEEASEEDAVETPEGNEIELPTVETVEGDIVEGDETEELAEDEMYGKDEDDMPSMFGMVKKPKVTFIV